MSDPAIRIPTYRLHRPSGLAVVTLSGRDIYLGAHGSPNSHIEYERVIAEWLTACRCIRPPTQSTLTAAEVVEAYGAHARAYYVKDGKPTSQQERVRRSLNVMLQLYSRCLVPECGPLKLKAVRERMVGLGWSRMHINHCVGCVKRAFKWAVAEELVPSSFFEALRAVEGLRRGRCAAREGRAVLPAPEKAIRAVQAVVSPQVRDLIEFQL